MVTVGRHFAPLTDGGRHWPSDWDGALQLPPGKYQELLGWPTPDRKREIALTSLFDAVPVSVMRRM